jgi:hypothetical protein
VQLAALTVWLVSTLAGLYLMIRWLVDGGLRPQATKVTRYPRTLIVGHPALAVAGLALWVVFLVTHDEGYAWAALVVITAVALLGFTMLTRWLGGGRHARDAGRRRPVIAILLHGVTGLSTFVLVMLITTTIRW